MWRVHPPVWPLFSYLYDLCSATCLTSVQLPGEDEPGPQWCGESTLLSDLCSATCLTSVQFPGKDESAPQWGGEPTLLCDLCLATCMTSVRLPVWPLFSYLYEICSATWRGWAWPQWGGESTFLCDLCSATCLTSVQLPVRPLFSYMYDLWSATCLTPVQSPPSWMASVQLHVWPLFSYLERMSLAPSEVESPPYLGTYQRIRHMSGLRHALHPLPSSQR